MLGLGKKAASTTLAPRTEPGLTRWNPWSEWDEIRRQMDNLYSRAFGYTPLSEMIPVSGFNFEPAVDIYTSDDKVFAYAALPGFTPDAIHVEAGPDSLIIHGERKALHDTDRSVPEQKNGVTEESQFRIQCTLPAEIDPNKVKANFKNGVLELEMPKTEQAKTKSVKVTIKGE